MGGYFGFPRQQLPGRKKNKAWRDSVLDWAANHTYFNCAPVRKSMIQMKINYDLVNGKIHMDDVAAILNPGDLSTAFIPDRIQHYPILNSKLNTLRGEEAARVFDWHVVVTNPTAVSDMEERRRDELMASIQGIVESQSYDQGAAEKELRESLDYYNYNWQDLRERQGNEVLNHYSKEQNFGQTFNDGFMDAVTVATEIYECGIVGGEPVLTRMNPLKLSIWSSGYSNRIEDADVLIYTDYLSKARVVDLYYDDLSAEDMRKLDEGTPDTSSDEDERFGFVNADELIGEDGIWFDRESGLGHISDALYMFDGGYGSDLMPYDTVGNVRVIRIWWKSRRKVLSVKSFDPETGDEVFDLYPETYVPDKAAGEEAHDLWINEAWEGTLIGDDIRVRVRPCLVQYNSVTHPSRCHFGIIGTIYNLNESRPYSLVDMMKPYSYLYDAVHAKMVDLIATNWGKLLVMDFAKKPAQFTDEQWMYLARTSKILMEDSFKEGDKGTAMGKLAGGLNNASKGYIDADWASSIANYMNLLQWIKDSMSDLVGINRQREGNTYNRETAGGIERAVLQSSYITDWLFMKHDDTKRRVLECFLETFKVAYRGRSKKFPYILSDGSRRIMDIDGNDFAESDYGLVVDNSNDTQKLYQQMETLAQAALQNQQLDFATLMKLYKSASLSEKTRLVEQSQERMQRAQQEAQQAQAQAQQAVERMRQETEERKMQLQDMLNQRDNETRIRVAELDAQAEYLRLGIYADENSEELRREEMDIDRERNQSDAEAKRKELELKEKELKQKKELELKKIEAQKQIASARKTSGGK